MTSKHVKGWSALPYTYIYIYAQADFLCMFFKPKHTECRFHYVIDIEELKAS